LFDFFFRVGLGISGTSVGCFGLRSRVGLSVFDPGIFKRLPVVCRFLFRVYGFNNQFRARFNYTSIGFDVGFCCRSCGIAFDANLGLLFDFAGRTG
jgi:hypothetical protein